MNVTELMEGIDDQMVLSAEEMNYRTKVVCDACVGLLEKVDEWFNDANETEEILSNEDLTDELVDKIKKNGDLVFGQLEILIFEANALLALHRSLPQQRIYQ